MKFNAEHLMNHTTKLRKIDEKDLQPNRKYIIVDVYKTCHYVGIFDEYTTSQWNWHNRPAFKEVIEINPLEMDDNMDYLLGDVKKMDLIGQTRLNMKNSNTMVFFTLIVHFMI